MKLRIVKHRDNCYEVKRYNTVAPYIWWVKMYFVEPGWSFPVVAPQIADKYKFSTLEKAEEFVKAYTKGTEVIKEYNL